MFHRDRPVRTAGGPQRDTERRRLAWLPPSGRLLFAVSEAQMHRPQNHANCGWLLLRDCRVAAESFRQRAWRRSAAALCRSVGRRYAIPTGATIDTQLSNYVIKSGDPIDGP